MDRKALVQKLKDKAAALIGNRKLLIIVGVSTFALIAGVTTSLIFFSGSKGHDEKSLAHAEKGSEQAASRELASKTEEHGKAAEQSAPEAQPVKHEKQGFLGGLVKTYAEAYQSAQTTVDALHRAEFENRQLKLENANLRLKVESRRFSCDAADATGKTNDFGMKLEKETGAKVGRSLASMNYRPPTHLLPPQLYTLGVTYFKAREDEKAAVILTFLTGLDENDAYKSPKNYLMTGISWFRVDNYELADEYFDRVLKSEVKPENLPVQAKARLWKALVADKAEKHTKAQYWLRELIDHHPHSTEAAWVNSREVGRVPASDKSEKEQHASDDDEE